MRSAPERWERAESPAFARPPRILLADKEIPAAGHCRRLQLSEAGCRPCRSPCRRRRQPPEGTVASPFNGDQILACENTGVLPCVPKTLTSSSAKRGLFARQDFVYDAEKDHYTCPAGQHLTRGRVRPDRRQDVDNYR